MPKTHSKQVEIRVGSAGAVVGNAVIYVTSKSVVIESTIDVETWKEIFGEELPGGVTLWRKEK